MAPFGFQPCRPRSLRGTERHSLRRLRELVGRRAARLRIRAVEPLAAVGGHAATTVPFTDSVSSWVATGGVADAHDCPPHDMRNRNVPV